MASKKTTKAVDDTAAVMERIAAWPDDRRALGERLHALITDAVPELKPRVWYGMPGYAKAKSSPVLCFFRTDDYMTFGLTEKAAFAFGSGTDAMQPSSWFFTELDEELEKRIVDIVKAATA